MSQNCFQIYGLSQKSKTLEPQSWWFAPKMVQSNIVPEHLIVKRQTSYQTSYQFLAVSHKFPSTQQTRDELIPQIYLQNYQRNCKFRWDWTNFAGYPQKSFDGLSSDSY